MKDLKRNRVQVLLILSLLPVLVWASAAGASTNSEPAREPKDINQTPAAFSKGPTTTLPAPTHPSSPQSYQFNWLSINGGGAVNASLVSYRLGYSVGQPVAGAAASASYQMGIGFWFASGCAAAKGDMNASGGWSPADVVLMLNCVFLGAGNCDLCFADVNCDQQLTPSDVVLELNKVFLGSSFPCA